MNILNIIKRPERIVELLGARGYLHTMDDRRYIELTYKGRFGIKPNLDNPKTFNEKIQWIKLNCRYPFMTKLVDKIACKDWISEHLGADLVVPTYAIWNTPDEIDIDVLPDKFVLKNNHDSSGAFICTNKETFDLESIKKSLASNQSKNFYYMWREWAYKDVQPRILAEAYLETDAPSIVDYKLYCFNNGRMLCSVCEERGSQLGTVFTYFDEDWQCLNLHDRGHRINPSAQPPVNFERMKALGQKFMRKVPELPFVRLDFYEMEDRLYLGEITLYTAGGMEDWLPYSYQDDLGSWIHLPEKQYEDTVCG